MRNHLSLVTGFGSGMGIWIYILVFLPQAHPVWNDFDYFRLLVSILAGILGVTIGTIIYSTRKRYDNS